MAESSRQWKRRAQVVVGKSGSGLLIENLRIAFEVVKTATPAPNTAIIRIWNLSPDNAARVRNEYDELLLNAGYEDAMRLVFRGNIKHVYRYRDGNDWITEVEAADGDKDYRNAVINQTLAAGTSKRQLVDRCVGTFTGGTKQGHIDLPEKTLQRGRVVSGNTRAVLDECARDSGANWSIQDGQLVMVGTSKMLPNQAIVIRSDTGMLGSPEINDKGVTVKCLMNPQIAINGAVKLDNDSLRAKRGTGKKVAKRPNSNGSLQQQPDEEIVDDPTQMTGQVAKLSSDGIYKAIKLTHKGDTRGGEWQTETLCIAI